MSQSAVFYINNTKHTASGEDLCLPLADYLRNIAYLPGTKIVCAEGDCGACTVLVAKPSLTGSYSFLSLNSCILPVYLLNGLQVVTVEGLAEESTPSPVQKALVEHHGSQCGFCTPGIAGALTGYVEECFTNNKSPCASGVKNHLTGNLCRCTGYEAILKSADNLELKDYRSLSERYLTLSRIKELGEIRKKSFLVTTEKAKIFLPTTLAEALEFKKQNPNARIVAGATDLGVLINKRGLVTDVVMSLQQVTDLKRTSWSGNDYFISCQTTLSEFEKLIEKEIPELNHLLHRFASPQIKNQGTVTGNLVNASPIADLIPFFLVSNSKVILASTKGTREVLLSEFYLGYKKIDLQPEEIVVGIQFTFDPTSKLKLYKVSQRRDLDISCITFAGILNLENEKIKEIRLAMGGISATVIRLETAEKSLIHQKFEKNIFEKVANQVMNEINPLSDLRGSKEYRKMLSRNLIMKFYAEVL